MIAQIPLTVNNMNALRSTGFLTLLRLVTQVYKLKEFQILHGCCKTTSHVLTILVILSSGVPLRISAWRRTIGTGILAQTVTFLIMKILLGFQVTVAILDD